MIINTKIIARACDGLKIPCRFLDKSQNLLAVKIKNEWLYFVHTTTPFNSESVARIDKDKDYTYELLKDVIRVPRTISFFDPQCDEDYKEYRTHKDVPGIVKEIGESFTCPVIIKRNSGAQGENVHLCGNAGETANAVKEIFNKNSRTYDYIALAQERVDIKIEYRAIVFKKRVVLLYAKDILSARFVGNLSPLHYENAKAILIEDKATIEKIQGFALPVFEKLDLVFGGLDIALGKDNLFWLLELNTHPGFSIFIKDNGEEAILNMYAAILKTIC